MTRRRRLRRRQGDRGTGLQPIGRGDAPRFAVAGRGGSRPSAARNRCAVLRPVPPRQRAASHSRPQSGGGSATAGRVARGIPAPRRERVAGLPPGRASGPTLSVQGAHQRLASRSRSSSRSRPSKRRWRPRGSYRQPLLRVMRPLVLHSVTQKIIPQVTINPPWAYSSPSPVWVALTAL